MIEESSCKRENSLIYITALIGLGFFWMGGAYIIQAYRLMDFIYADRVNLIVCGLYYVLQAIGIGGVGLLYIKYAKLASGMKLPFWSTFMALILTAISLFTNVLSFVIISGALLNICIGIISACYLTRLATDVPEGRRGLVFGSAYAFGSIGTWLLSMPMGGLFLWQDASFIGIVGLAVLSLIVLTRLPLQKTMMSTEGFESKIDKRFVCLVGIFLFLLSLENMMGFSFPLQGAADSVYIEFTRGFYGVGLIIAGLVSDKSRRWGAIFCISALAFPFVALALGNSVSGESFMWILAYTFLGFWSVYRILVFSDISAKTNIPSFAVLGLLFGRLGEAAGTLGASTFKGSYLIVISGLLFAVIIVLFFQLYQKLYNPTMSPEDVEKQMQIQYVNGFGMSMREQDVFNLMIQGMSNIEIANSLYISESTVKFHINNIFKKTGFKSRLELISDYIRNKNQE